MSYNVSGDLYFDEGDYKQAIKEYKAGLQIKPDDVNLLNSLGVALTEINRHREAESCFSQVLQTEPQNYMALINKGMSCRLLGRSEEAIACFEQGLHCKEHEKQASIELYLQLGKLYCLRKNLKKLSACSKNGENSGGNRVSLSSFVYSARHQWGQESIMRPSRPCSGLYKSIPRTQTARACWDSCMSWKDRVQK
ncbi:tetratricopeptide repeat protein [Desulfobulbus sp. US2]|nr:tetratricopeptide repeat protein [Desulfobulbus sp. US2]